MRTKINGVTWTVEVISSKEMKKHRADGDDIAGLCIADDKAIYIARDCLDFKTVLHELFHAYVSSLHLDDTNNIPIEEIEEIFASHFTEKAQTIVSKAKRVFKKLMEEK